MNDFFTQKEIDGLKGDIETSSNINLANQIMFANKIKGKLGNEIKEYLTNPPKIDKKGLRRYRRRKKFEEFCYRIKLIFNF